MKKIFLIGYLMVITVYGLGQVKDSAKAKKDTVAYENYDMVFTKVDIESSFEGGRQAWGDFLRKNINGNVPKNNGSPVGHYTVEVEFVVDKDGTVSDINIVKNPGYGTSEEVIRIMKLSPKWKPGIQNGVFVKSRKKQKVTFLVEKS